MKLKIQMLLLALSLLIISVQAQDDSTVSRDESYGKGVVNEAAAWMLTSDYWKPGDTDLLLTVFFYVNIVWYLIYCDFMASRTF